MQRQRTGRMARIGLFSALIAACAWIAIPATVPLTMQSFAVLLASALLRDWDAPCAVLVYLALGIVGLPVFSGMRGGVGVLLSPTGGFLLGFLAAAVWMAKTERLRSGSLPRMALCMAAAQLWIYLFGVLWFAVSAHVGFVQAAAVCVLPYLLPDLIKLLLAAWLSVRLRPLVR